MDCLRDGEMKCCAFSTLTFQTTVRRVISMLLNHSAICRSASVPWLGVSAVHPEYISQIALSCLGVRKGEQKSWKSKSKMIAWGYRLLVSSSSGWLLLMAIQKQIINSLYKDHNLLFWKPQHFLSVKMKGKQRNTVSASVQCMNCLVRAAFCTDCHERP